MSTSDTQQKLQTLSDEYQTLQTDLESQISSLRRLESQHQENTSVRNEFSTLTPESNIYKLVGPVLLKQEKAEAETAVQGRLEFIGKEMKRVEKLISDLQSQSEGKKMEVRLAETHASIFLLTKNLQVYQLQVQMQESV
ncbi:MAG: hypothetical protein Q9170_006628 [Blastenia crenularia]